MIIRICSWLVSSAHPRSRGEHRPSLTALPPPAGSSPLARGTLPATDAYVNAWRLIPARAGNIRRYRFCIPLVAAHPRSRGEHPCASLDLRARRGSSPLARGTWETIKNAFQNGRLIPARAGNIVRPLCLGYVRSAHPRSRGEHNTARRPGV